MNEEDFIKLVKDTCKENGIKCLLKPVRYIMLDKKSNSRCSGYFDETTKTLCVSMKHPLALDVLVHEFNHLMQWKNNIAVWRITTELKAFQLFYSWLDGSPVKNINRLISYVRDLELDNEIRSVEMIKEYSLPIDVNLYIKRANSYIYFYNWIKHSKQWCKPNNSPYMNKRLVDIMPEHFNNNYNHLPENIKKVFAEENI
jgi:hypothetical protein